MGPQDKWPTLWDRQRSCTGHSTASHTLLCKFQQILIENLVWPCQGALDSTRGWIVLQGKTCSYLDQQVWNYSADVRAIITETLVVAKSLSVSTAWLLWATNISLDYCTNIVPLLCVDSRMIFILTPISQLFEKQKEYFRELGKRKTEVSKRHFSKTKVGTYPRHHHAVCSGIKWQLSILFLHLYKMYH